MIIEILGNRFLLFSEHISSEVLGFCWFLCASLLAADPGGGGYSGVKRIGMTIGNTNLKNTKP